MSRTTPLDIDLRCWSLDMLQHGASRKLLEQVFDAQRADTSRERAMRKLLRDGSSITWLMLCEFMHDMIARRGIALEDSPFQDAVGALRVKALKILWEPSSSHGEDHLSALRWLQHCVRKEDIPLMCELLRAYADRPELSTPQGFVGLHVMGIMARERQRKEASMLLHTMLFEVPPPDAVELADVLLRTPRADDWFVDALWHAFTTSEDLLVRAACIKVLDTRWPAHFAQALDVFFEEEDGPLYRAQTYLYMNLNDLRERDRSTQRRGAQVCEILTQLQDPDMIGPTLHDMISDTSRHAPDALLHGTLPYLLDYSIEAQDLLLTYLPHTPGAMGCARLFIHHFHHTTSPHIQLKIVEGCQDMLIHHSSLEPADSTTRAALRHAMGIMLYTLLQGDIYDGVLNAPSLAALGRLLNNHPYFCELTLTWLTTQDETPEPARTLLSVASRCEQMLAYISHTHTKEEIDALTHTLQRLHDTSNHEPLIMSLRKLLNATRKLK